MQSDVMDACEQVIAILARGCLHCRLGCRVRIMHVEFQVWRETKTAFLSRIITT